MGISFTSAAFMTKKKYNENVCFDNILTLGHQTLYVHKRYLKKISEKHGLSIDYSDIRYGDYSDNFFRFFWAQKIFNQLMCPLIKIQI